MNATAQTARPPCPRCGWQRPPQLFAWPDDNQPAARVCYSCWTVLHTPGAVCARDVGDICLNAGREADCPCRAWQQPGEAAA